jgi:hypothetical protein
VEEVKGVQVPCLVWRREGKTYVGLASTRHAYPSIPSLNRPVLALYRYEIRYLFKIS